MAQIVQMTTEQLQQIIQEVRASAVAAAGAAATGAAGISKGSLANCNARYGGERDHDAVEEFITSIVTYKEIEMITDEDAYKSISLLLYGTASTWWQGIRKEAKTWNDALSLIREHFSPVKPPHQLYLEIFDKRQDNSTAIDTFVCQKRALFAQLPDGRHDEETEIDFVYALMNIKYRKYIARRDIKSFRDLLESARIIEHNNMEDEEANKRSSASKGPRNSKRCTYCNFRGHTQDECRKRKTADKSANDD